MKISITQIVFLGRKTCHVTKIPKMTLPLVIAISLQGFYSIYHQGYTPPPLPKTNGVFLASENTITLALSETFYIAVVVDMPM